MVRNSNLVTKSSAYMSIHQGLHLFIYIYLAFPSIGCGKLGFDPAIIAKHMINSTQTELKKLNTNV